MYKYNSDDVYEWYNRYLKTKSILEVSRYFGVSNCTIAKKFKKLNLKMSGNKRLFCNDNFFSIDTPESFYWAGFIAVDGCIFVTKYNKKRLQISLNAKDEDHLNKFKNSINFTGIVRNYNGRRNVSIINVCSDKLCNDLGRFGIFSKKSLSLKFPIWLSEHKLVNHFLRGYIDGDGGFNTYTPKNPKHRKSILMSVCGTKEFLEIFRYVLHKNCNSNNNSKIFLEKSIHRIFIGGNNNIIRIRNFLYSNSNEQIYMYRKYILVYNDWIDVKPRSTKCKPIIGINTINGQIIKFDSIIDAQKNGFNSPSIVDCLHNRRKSHKSYVWAYQ